MSITRFHHVQIAAPRDCEASARAFYGELLDRDEMVKPCYLARLGGVWLVGGAQELHVGSEAGFRPSRKAHPAFPVDGLDGPRRRLISSGKVTR